MDEREKGGDITSIWKKIAIIEFALVLVLLATMVFAAILYIKGKNDAGPPVIGDVSDVGDDAPNGGVPNDGTPSGVDNGGDDGKEGVATPKSRHVEDLSRLIDALNASDNDFLAYAKRIYGYEYLCFELDGKNGKVLINYKNEYEPVTDALDESGVWSDWNEVIIENGHRRVMYSWENNLSVVNRPSNGLLGVYALRGTEAPYDEGTYVDMVRGLCPVMAGLAGEGTEQLLFFTYDYDGVANEGVTNDSVENNNGVNDGANACTNLLIMDAYSLNELKSVNFEGEILKSFDIVMYEEPDVADGARLQLGMYSAVYKYRISEGLYTSSVGGTYISPIRTGGVMLDIGEDGISFNTVLMSGEDEYLGEYKAKVTYDGTGFVISGIQYGAYVEANQEDMDRDGLIIPRKEPIGDYVTLYGNNAERFIIEKSKVLEPFKYDMENVVTDEKGVKSYHVGGEPVSRMGIDVSRYQGNIDWGKVASSGVDFAFIRLGYRGMNRGPGNGNLTLDDYYARNIQGALRANIDVGVYFFSQAITVKEAKEEADMVIKNLKGYDVTYPVVFDAEHTVLNGYSGRANDLTRQERTDIAKVFCETVEAAGYKAMIYANTKWMIMGMDLEQLDMYPRWFAYYGNNFMFPYDVRIWQYSDSGKIAGISGNVDMNIEFVGNAQFSNE